MAKCEICGSTSIATERFGDIYVCKSCIMKEHGFIFANDTVWTVEEEHSAEKNYFLADSALLCECCGRPVRFCQAIGDADICSSCYEKLNAPAWISYKYEENKEVEAHRAVILNIAKEHGVPNVVIDGINKHFDNKLQKDLICVIDGGKG